MYFMWLRVIFYSFYRGIHWYEHTRPPKLTKGKLKEIESSNCEDAESLANGLFLNIFQDELTTKPDLVCCTVAEGKELLDQELLKGIQRKC